MSNLGQPVRIKYIPSLAFLCHLPVTCDRQAMQASRQDLGEGSRVLSPVTYSKKRYGTRLEPYKKISHKKLTHWFKLIGTVLQDPAVLAENMYNMDKC